MKPWSQVIGRIQKTKGNNRKSVYLKLLRGRFVNWLYSHLALTDMRNWYNVTAEIIFKNGGHGILYHYNSSPSKALQSVYPQHNWMLWRYKRVPLRYWKSDLMKDSKQITTMFDWLTGKLAIKCLDDWY